MKFLSLQHIEIEDPGTFKDYLLADGHEIITIQPVSYTHLTLPTICSV